MPQTIIADFSARLTRLGFEGRSLIAKREQDFNLSDAVEAGLPGRRFVQGGHLGDRWFIWYERGGFAPSMNVVAYQLSGMSAKPDLLGLVAQGNYLERPCDRIVAFLKRHGAEPGHMPYGL